MEPEGVIWGNRSAYRGRGEVSTPGTFSSPPCDEFLVRGPNYLEDKKKQPSAPALFQLAGVDAYLSSAPISHAFSKIPSLTALLAFEEYEYFLCNFALPGKRLTNVFLLFRRALLDSDGSPADRLYKHFRTTSEPGFQKNRIKYVFTIRDGPWMLRRSIASLGGERPVLMCQRMATEIHQGDRYFECDVNISSSTPAQMLSSIVLGASEKMTVDMGFAIEPRTPAEMPERLLAAIRIDHLSLSSLIHNKAYQASIPIAPVSVPGETPPTSGDRASPIPKTPEILPTVPVAAGIRGSINFQTQDLSSDEESGSDLDESDAEDSAANSRRLSRWLAARSLSDVSLEVVDSEVGKGAVRAQLSWAVAPVHSIASVSIQWFRLTVTEEQASELRTGARPEWLDTCQRTRIPGAHGVLYLPSADDFGCGLEAEITPQLCDGGVGPVSRIIQRPFRDPTTEWELAQMRKRPQVIFTLSLVRIHEHCVETATRSAQPWYFDGQEFNFPRACTVTVNAGGVRLHSGGLLSSLVGGRMAWSCSFSSGLGVLVDPTHSRRLVLVLAQKQSDSQGRTLDAVALTMLARTPSSRDVAVLCLRHFQSLAV